MTSPSIEAIDNRTILEPLRKLAKDHSLTFSSCLDIGCGRSRYDRWFAKVARASEPRRYIGLDTDAQIVEELRAAGVDARNPLDDPVDCPSDLVLCHEVFEHISPSDSLDFLEFAKRQTKVALALTSPNFEYWDGRRQKREYKECRWIPDHFLSFKPHADPVREPHVHRQATTPASVYDQLTRVFHEEHWRLRVFRAWPWLLRDLSVGTEFTLYFKVFALVWKSPDRGS